MYNKCADVVVRALCMGGVLCVTGFLCAMEQKGMVLAGLTGQGSSVATAEQARLGQAPGVLYDHVKPGQNQEGMSKEKICAVLKLMPASRPNQVIAAWLQLKLSQEPGSSLQKLMCTDWGLEEPFCQKVKNLVRAIEGFACDKKFCFSLYKLVFEHVASEDRIIPGRGNNRQALRTPERLCGLSLTCFKNKQ